MSSQVWTTVLALVSVGVGFAGGLLVEFLRGRQAVAREARERRERFQVETLLRLQDVTNSIYKGVFKYRNELNGEEPTSVHDIEDRMAINVQRIEDAAELQLLMSRVQDEHIHKSASILFEVCTLMTKREVEADEVDKAVDLALEICHGIQYAAGSEIRRILGITSADEGGKAGAEARISWATA